MFCKCDVFHMHTYSFSIKLIIYYVLIRCRNNFDVNHFGISYFAAHTTDSDYIENS